MRIQKNLTLEEVQQRIHAVSAELLDWRSAANLMKTETSSKLEYFFYSKIEANAAVMMQYVKEIQGWIQEQHPEWYVEKYPQNPYFKTLLDKKVKQSSNTIN